MRVGAGKMEHESSKRLGVERVIEPAFTYIFRIETGVERTTHSDRPAVLGELLKPGVLALIDKLRLHKSIKHFLLFVLRVFFRNRFFGKWNGCTYEK